MKRRPAKQSANGPLYGELPRVYAMLAEGRSDASIALALSADRPHGSGAVDPSSIAKLRDGR